MLTFWGYKRQDTRVGVRNSIAVIATVSCANTVVQKIAAQSPLAIAVTHETGCLQIAVDRVMTERAVKGMALHPNAGATILVGLGCEQIDTEAMALAITGKLCKAVIIQKEGGTTGAVKKGVEILRDFERELAAQKRQEFPLDQLVVGLKCGGSDFTNGIASNPALGLAMDRLVAEGGTAILTETPGFAGSEHILAERSVTPEIATKIWQKVNSYRDEVKCKFNHNINDGNPSPGNKAGGITTLVEKSMGTVKKGGSSPIQGVLDYAEWIGQRRGLWIMDTPGYDIFSLSGPASGGAQILAFTTGRGTPLGCALTPVAKICANPKTVQIMRENIDIDVSGIITGTLTLEQAGEMIFTELVRTASGLPTATETLGHYEFAILRSGCTL